jgi:hypothetical protein
VEASGYFFWELATKKSIAKMIAVLRLHLMSCVALLEFIKDIYKAWRKTYKASFLPQKKWWNYPQN